VSYIKIFIIAEFKMAAKSNMAAMRCGGARVEPGFYLEIRESEQYKIASEHALYPYNVMCPT
jgi:hypothetical protein